MILNSFSELNATACPGAFQELNGLTILVPNEEQGNPPVPSPQNAYASLPIAVEPDFTQGEDLLLKALQSPPFPSLARGAEQATSNDVLRYLNLAPGESDAETGSKFSAESSSSRELPLPPLTPSVYPEKRPLTVSAVCGGADGIQREGPGVGTKRKPPSSTSSSKRAKVTQTSKFCHICVRSGEQVTLVPCANVIGAVCRKAVCHRCFEKHGYTHEWASACQNREIIRRVHAGLLERLPDNVWTCLHCRSLCPASAQCKIYARTNKRRHMILKQRKAERDRLLAQQNAMNRSFRVPANSSRVGVGMIGSVVRNNHVDHGDVPNVPCPALTQSLPPSAKHPEPIFRQSVAVKREPIEPSPYSPVQRH